MNRFPNNLARRFEHVLQQIFRRIQNRLGKTVLQRSPKEGHLQRVQGCEVHLLGLDMQVWPHRHEGLGGKRRRERRWGVCRHHRPDEEGGNRDVHDPDD